MEAYAEGGLDRIVRDQFFPETSDGVFIDVGAAGPHFLSMSALFRAHGWRVIAIEPNPAFCAAQRAAGHEVLEYACADRDADDVPFDVVDSHGSEYEGGEVSFESFSSLKVKDSYQAFATGQLDVRQITVRVRRLDSILAVHAPELQRVEILSVDVEGWELEVLLGFSLERYQPKVLIVENVFEDAAYGRALGERGYTLWRHVKPNDVYIPVSQKGEATRKAVEVVDGSGWLPPFGSEPIVSYSQNAEDVRLLRVFRTVENGFYVDVGAADPTVDSVTRLFYDRGWSGINVEPNPCFESISEARTRDVNLRVVVGELEEPVSFFLTYPYLGMSAVDPSIHGHMRKAIERIEETSVPQRRLDSILREHAADRTIHFLKVDVEGAELQVLGSCDWDSFRPIVIVAEAIESWSTSSRHESWEPLILDAGYQFAAFDGVNRFYVDRDHAHLIPILAYPISPLDSFVAASTRELMDRVDQTHELRQKTSEVETLRQSLDAVYRSRTWRAGRAIARAARPFRSAGEHLPRPWLR